MISNQTELHSSDKQLDSSSGSTGRSHTKPPLSGNVTNFTGKKRSVSVEAIKIPEEDVPNEVPSLPVMNAAKHKVAYTNDNNVC